jgi:hypothetical protein
MDDFDLDYGDESIDAYILRDILDMVDISDDKLFRLQNELDYFDSITADLGAFE